MQNDVPAHRHLWRLPVLAAWSLLACLNSCNSHAPATADAEAAQLDEAPVLIAAPTTAPTAAATQPILSGLEGQLQESVMYLSGDELEGRGLNTRGINLAAAYIAGHFHGAGLQPLPGQRDFFQNFELATLDGLEDSSTLACGTTAWRPNVDFTAGPSKAAEDFSGGVVFAGYGITSQNGQADYDDYAGLDVKGKVVLVFRFEPADAQGHSLLTKGAWSPRARFAEKVHTAAEHGAVALLWMNPPRDQESDSLIGLDERSVGGAAAIPLLQITRGVGRELLKQGGINDAEALQDSIDHDFKPHSRALAGVSVTGKIVLRRTTRHLQNVMALLPGSGPLADQYIVVGAHYDHLGRGEPGSLAMNSHDIHHGADDNASGTAVILEIAAQLAQEARTQPLQRSVIFIAFSGEERGLLGSHYFVEHPPLELNKIVAMLNLDMVGRLRNQSLSVGPSDMDHDLEQVLDDADRGMPLHLKSMGHLNFAQWASDHTSFALKHIPVVFLFTGLHADYHRPSDTADKVNYAGMAEIVEFSKKIVRGLDGIAADHLAQAGAKLSPRMPGGGTGHGGASLGVMPDYSSADSVNGVAITGTMPHSPAETAGLQDGDRIIALGNQKIDSLEDLSDALGKARPGDKVKIKIVRGKEERTLEATLAARP